MLKQILIFLIFSIVQKINQSVSIFQKINKSVVKMLSRSARAETRQSSKREVKKVMLNEDKVIFSLPVFNLFHPFLFYTKGGTLGEAMDSDPKHNDEAIQVGAGVPRLGQGGEEQEQDGRAEAEEALHRPVCGHQLSGKLECGRGLQYVHRLHCERLYGWTHTDYNSTRRCVPAWGGEADDNYVRGRCPLHRGDEHGGRTRRSRRVCLAQQRPLCRRFCQRSEKWKRNSLLCKRGQEGGRLEGWQAARASLLLLRWGESGPRGLGGRPQGVGAEEEIESFLGDRLLAKCCHLSCTLLTLLSFVIWATFTFKVSKFQRKLNFTNTNGGNRSAINACFSLSKYNWSPKTRNILIQIWNMKIRGEEERFVMSWWWWRWVRVQGGNYDAAAAGIKRALIIRQIDH